MTTRATLKAEILDDLDRSSTADGTRVLSAISSAIKFYQSKRFFFNESRAVTFSTADGTSDYTFASIGTEFYRLDGVFVTISSSDVRELDRSDPLEIESLIANEATTGQPSEYAYFDRTLRLWRIPDAIYSVRLVGHVKIAEPATDDTANNEWFTEAYELIRCRAKAYLYAHVFPDPSMAQVMQAAEQQALGTLMLATVAKVELGRLEPTEF